MKLGRALRLCSNLIEYLLTPRQFAVSAVVAVALLTTNAAKADVQLTKIGSYASGVFGRSAAEIVTHDETTQRLFVQNAYSATIDIIDIRDPTAPFLVTAVDVGGQPTSVNAHGGVVAVSVEGANQQALGRVVFLDTDGQLLNQVTVGARPDMLVFSPDGQWLLVANEGVPNDAYTIDPEGSVSIVDMRPGVRAIASADVRTADLQAFNRVTLDPSIRIFGANNPSIAQDLEPEHIAISPDSRTAWVAFQENNAIGILDIGNAMFTDVVGLGFQDHRQPNRGLDASDRDGAVNIQNWPVFGLYQPDTMAAYSARGQVYIVTANEGDARDYSGFSEEVRVRDLVLDPSVFPNAATLQNSGNLGRLKTTTTMGDVDGDGDVDQIFAFGARSFSIRAASGHLVFDSGDDFEQLTAALLHNAFNSGNAENGSFDKRNDDKGPEPEYVVVGQIDGESYAFIGLERIGGIVIYKITDPVNAVFVDYLNTREFAGDPALGSAGDLSPEGLKFISGGDSPTGKALLVVAFEVSGTIGIFEIEQI